jgi:putative oxidoreductase
MAILSSLSKYSDIGLLIIRLGLGIMFIMHGYPKLTGGPEKWEKLGGAMGNVGVNFLPVFWGFLAAITEAVGGLLFALGLFFRPTAFALAFTMLIATLVHLSGGDGVMGASHSIEVGIVFFGFILVGPGKYSIDKK